MSAPVRFLALAVLAWAGVRAATLGILPGAEAFTATAEAQAAPPPIVPTEFPPLEPVQAALPAGMSPQHFAYAYPALPPQPYPYYHHPVAARAAQSAAPLHGASAAIAAHAQIMPEPEPLFYSPIPQLDEWPLSRLASASVGDRRNASPVPTAGHALPQPGRIDRLQLSAWALLRGRPGAGSLASGGTLGGSQAGARLTYALDRRLAVSLRSYSPVGTASGGEVAAGLRLTPLPAIPLSITAERRQAIGRDGGRSAFALFVEGGVYQRPLPWDLSLDAYAQAGVVGARRRDLFADGGLTLMRPVHGRFSAGLGLWAGAQTGIYRVDAGPRISMRVPPNMRVDLDWRQRLGGHAEPGSGPAVTLGGNF